LDFLEGGFFRVDYLLYYKNELKGETKETFIPFTYPNKKTQWVKDKIMYLKMYLSNNGCRTIAKHFNQQYAHKSITVSKSYVYCIMEVHAYEILQQRKEMRNKTP
jgi:hypothetical protein